MSTSTRSRSLAAAIAVASKPPTSRTKPTPPDAPAQLGAVPMIKTQLQEALNTLSDVIRLRDQLVGSSVWPSPDPAQDDLPTLIDLAARGNVLSAYTEAAATAIADIKREFGL